MIQLKKALLLLFGIPSLVILIIVFIWAGVLFTFHLFFPDPDCAYKKPLFQENSYKSAIYKKELIRLLKKTDDLDTDYWLYGYADSNHVKVYIQNDSICAIAYAKVNYQMDDPSNFLSYLERTKCPTCNTAIYWVSFEFKEKDDPEIILKYLRVVD